MKSTIHNLAHRAGPPLRRPGPGFTMVDLLAIVSVLVLTGLCAWMILPRLDGLWADPGYPNIPLLQNLENGCHMYKMSATGNKYYPGQQHYERFGGERGTGSAELARALFTDPNGVFPTAAYAPLEPTMLADCNGVANTIVDDFSGRLPVLYYPARRNAPPRDRYKESHNAAYLHAAVKGDAYRVEDPNATQFAPGFLLIAAGRDGRYFSRDDYRSWK